MKNRLVTYSDIEGGYPGTGTVVNIRGRSYRLRDKVQTVTAPITTATRENADLRRPNNGRTTY